MDTKNMSLGKKAVWAIVAVVVVILAAYGAAGMIGNEPAPATTQEEIPGIAAYTFACAQERSIRATFNNGEDDTVDLILSDGRTFTLPQVVSGSGARFANQDESFVFWTKGNTAFVTEGKDGKTTYADCVIIPPRLSNEE